MPAGGGARLPWPGAWLKSPAARVAAVFVALFFCTGVTMPFLTPWLAESRGLAGAEIGAIFAAAQLARLFTGAALAAWADGLKDRRTPIMIFAAGAFLAYAAFFTVEGFWPIFWAAFLATTMVQQIIPLTEAMALRRSLDGPLPYGVVRGLGSAAFILANVLGAAAIAVYGLGVAPIWALTALALTVAAALGLSADPAPPKAVQMGFRRRLREGLHLLANRRFALVLLGAGLIQASHAFYYVFSTVLWREQGLPDAVIGLLWAFGVLAEVGLLFALTRLERRFPPEMFMLLGAAAAALRWTLMATAPLGPALWALQALHAFTFAATHVGAMRIIHREAPEEVAGLAQTLYAALGGGLILGLATVSAGALYDAGGAAGYGVMAAMAVLGGILILPVAVAARRR